jgi:hypothetical protein
MTNFVAGPSCSTRSHGDDLAAFDKLDPEIRDRLRRARSNICSACVARMAMRDLPGTLEYLDFERTHRQALVRHRGRVMQVQIKEPELKP